jgi:hypothetical protein
VKRLLIFTILFSQIMSFVSCSPVRFNGTATCAGGKACINADGTVISTFKYTFTQTNKVDILIVDDNSGSMTHEQQNMANSFQGLVGSLNSRGIDWQIAVTNTDVCSDNSSGLCQNRTVPGYFYVPGARGRFMGPQGQGALYGNNIINNSTPNVESVFSQTIQRNNELGSGDERAIYASYLALFGGNASNAGFIRPDSNFALIILSDEDERSVGGSCPTSPFEFALSPTPGAQNYSWQYPCDPSYAPLDQYDSYKNFLNMFNQTYSGKKMAMHSIIIKPGDTNCLNAQVAQAPLYTGHYGNRYDEFAKQLAVPDPSNPNVIPDNSHSICDNGSGAFTSDVQNIAGNIINLNSNNNVALPDQPKVINAVFYDSSPSVPVGYTYVPGNNFITLNSTPPPNTTVDVTYTH